MKKPLIILVIIIGSVLIYQYPVQRILALRKFEEYIKAQGVDKETITYKIASKNWVTGGYVIHVKYRDDPNITYHYNYYVWTHRRGESLRLDRMLLTYSDEKRAIGFDSPEDGDCKYPPLDD